MNTNLKTVSDADLLAQVKAAVEQERLSTASVLRHLHEIERRRLHLERGFSSLHEYCVRALGYSDGAAHRRLSAMRLIAETPSVDTLVESGKLSLSTAAQLQNFFKAERRENKPYNAERRMALVEQSLGRSRREVERDLVLLSPGNSSLQRNTEKRRAISPTETALQLVLSAAQLAKLERFRQCTSHRNAAAKMAKLIEHAVDIALERVDPQKRRLRASLEKLVPKLSTTRYVPASTRQQLHAQAQGQCMYRDQLTGKRCEARSWLEIDHVLPYALGGDSTLPNLRLICRAHNQLLAIQAYGQKKMAPYLV